MDGERKNITDISTKNQEIISFFEKDSGFVFAYKKTEKLASAVYMVTGLFPENEPMKWTLRKKSSELLSFMLNYKDVKESDLTNFVYNVKSSVLEIVSLLEVSMRGGLVSSMNFSVLKNEFSSLTDLLGSSTLSQKGPLREAISSNFFDSTDLQNQRNISLSGAYTTSKSTYSEVKDNSNPAHKDEFKRSNRQNIILGLIKKKKEVTIKDVVVVIKDCSEKTIQRELISFINAGVLKRVGERRWSKYSLVGVV